MKLLWPKAHFSCPENLYRKVSEKSDELKFSLSFRINLAHVEALNNNKDETWYCVLKLKAATTTEKKAFSRLCLTRTILGQENGLPEKPSKWRKKIDWKSSKRWSTTQKRNFHHLNWIFLLSSWSSFFVFLSFNHFDLIENKGVTSKIETALIVKRKANDLQTYLSSNMRNTDCW